MKALSLWQPWASAILVGLKTIETRSWRTNYRGPLAIHAALKRKGDPRNFWDSLDMGEKDAFAKAGYSTFVQLPFGAVIVTCELSDCKPTEELQIPMNSDEREWGDFRPGRYGWVLSNIKPIQPFYTRGAQGLWEWLR